MTLSSPSSFSSSVWECSRLKLILRCVKPNQSTLFHDSNGNQSSSHPSATNQSPFEARLKKKQFNNGSEPRTPLSQNNQLQSCRQQQQIIRDRHHLEKSSSNQFQLHRRSFRLDGGHVWLSNPNPRRTGCLPLPSSNQ